MPVFARLSIFPLIAAALLVLFAQPVDAAEKVRARGWSSADYGRIIFDWPTKIRYDARIDGNSLTVTFARPMDADLDRVLKYLGGYVTGAALSEDGKSAIFGLSGQYDLDTFSSGNSVVVDLRRTKASAAPPRNTQMVPLRVQVGRHPGFTRLVFDWLDPIDYTVSRSGQNVSMRFAQSAVIDTEALAGTLVDTGLAAPSSRMDGRTLMFNLTVPAAAFIRHFRDGAKIVLDVQQEGSDFGGMVTAESPVGADTGPLVQAISPTGEILFILAMVGTTVAVLPERIPLLTEETAAANQPPKQPYAPSTIYDLNARGNPRNLLLYDRATRPSGG